MKHSFQGTSAANGSSPSLALTKRHHKIRTCSNSQELVVGIDLGTTNSAVAHIVDGRPKCIQNGHGSNLTPSVVTFLEDGEVIVGRQARRMAVSHPSTTYSSIKRIIGRKYEDLIVQEEASRLPFKLGQDDEGAVTIKCSAVDRGFLYPEEVSAQVLSQLIADAEERTGRTVRKAVISVPAYFETKQREATMDAGRLAGLETIRIIREPVAAALAYGLDLKQDRTVLVFDLGGGTYDVSLLEVGNGTIEVLSTGGDPHLGGDDWDAAIVDWIKAQLSAEAAAASNKNSNSKRSPTPTTPTSSKGLDFKDPKIQANLRSLAELAKIELSVNEEVTLKIPGGKSDGGLLQLVLTQRKLEELTEELWRRCRLPLDQACWNAGVDLDKAVGQLEVRKRELRDRGVPAWRTETLQPQINPKKRGQLSTVLLVGGATRMPSVHHFIKNMTGLDPLAPTSSSATASGSSSSNAGRGSRGGADTASVDPDEAVALGAAVQAGVLQGEVTGLMVMDQWQASLMRALAEMKLRNDPSVKQAVQQKYDLEQNDSAGSNNSTLPSAPQERQQPMVTASSSGRFVAGVDRDGGVMDDSVGAFKVQAAVEDQEVITVSSKEDDQGENDDDQDPEDAATGSDIEGSTGHDVRHEDSVNTISSENRKGRYRLRRWKR